MENSNKYVLHLPITMSCDFDYDLVSESYIDKGVTFKEHAQFIKKESLYEDFLKYKDKFNNTITNGISEDIPSSVTINDVHYSNHLITKRICDYILRLDNAYNSLVDIKHIQESTSQTIKSLETILSTKLGINISLSVEVSKTRNGYRIKLNSNDLVSQMGLLGREMFKQLEFETWNGNFTDESKEVILTPKMFFKIHEGGTNGLTLGDDWYIHLNLQSFVWTIRTKETYTINDI